MKTRVLTLIALAAVGAALAACESAPLTPPPLEPRAAPPPPPPPPTPAEEFAWSTARGNNSLTIALAYQPAAGQLWGCAGLAEALMPETSYSRGRMMTLYGSAERSIQPVAQVRARSAANPDTESGRFVKTATCDALDTFTFPGLADGAYFVIAQVKQTRPPGVGATMVIMQRVEVGGGRAVRMTLPQGAERAPAPAALGSPVGRPRRTQ